MKKIFLFIFLTFFSGAIFSQDKTIDLNEIDALKSVSDEACKCLEDVNTKNKNHDSVLKDINECLDKQVLIYQLTSKMKPIVKDAVNNKKDKIKTNINVSVEKNSKQYKQAYYEIEEYLMKNCERLKVLVAAADTMSDNSHSKNALAMEYYFAGVKEGEKQNWEKAIENYKLAVEKDPNFAFAWDNLGICYRRIGEYDKAIEAYRNSLKADPKGKMPLQNIPIAYVYKKEYQNAINAFLEMDKLYPGDAEVYYGIGQIYYEHLKDYEKSLDYMAKAYVIYTKNRSPYRTDAQNIIGLIYKQMLSENKKDQFIKILKANEINFE